MIHISIVTQDLLPVTVGIEAFDSLLDSAFATMVIHETIGVHNLHAIRFNSLTDILAFDVYSCMNIEKDGLYAQGTADVAMKDFGENGGGKHLFVSQSAKR